MRQRVSSQMQAGARAPIGGGGLNPSEREARYQAAGQLEGQGQHERAESCRAGGGC